MRDDGGLEGFLDRAADEIVSSSEFTREDAVSALCRSLRFFRDRGEPEDSARDLALETVAWAMEAAPRHGFELRPMVDQMLFSIFHRAPSRMGLIW